jgi:hypothetical protein
MARATTSRKPSGKADLGAFNARTADRPLWANLHGHPSIWIRWTAAHEDQVESEQAMTFGNRHVGVEVIGRIVRCGRYGEWYVGDWRPACGNCGGAGQVVVTVADDENVRKAYADALATTMDAGLYYMVQAAVECNACLGHPGWVVG